MTTATRPSLLNLNIIDNAHRIGAVISNTGRSTYYSLKNATTQDVKDFSLKAATNIGAGALTKAFVGAALAGAGAPVAVTIGVTAVSVAVVSTKITHWRDCKKAIANNEEPPKFNWKNYGLKGMFNAAMAGFGAVFSEQILGFFSPSAANAQEIVIDIEPAEKAPLVAPVFQDIIEQPFIEAVNTETPEIFALPDEDVPIAMPEINVPILPSPELDIADPIQDTAVFPAEINDIDLTANNESSMDVEESAFDATEPAQSEIPEVSDVEDVAPEETVPAAVTLDIIPDAVIDPITELQTFNLGERAEVALQMHLNGHAQGTADIGYFYFHGEQGLPQDYETAVQFYRDAAEAQNQYALRDLAYVEARAEKSLGFVAPANDIEIEEIEPEQTIEPADEMAVPDIELAAEEPVILEPAAEEVATIGVIEELQTMDLSARAETALQNHLDGNHQGTADLAYFFFHGEHGLPQDYEKAVQLYREAAAEGNRYALRDLAFVESQAEKALGYVIPQESVEDISVVFETTTELSAADTLLEELEALDLAEKAERALGAHMDNDAQGTADLALFLFHGHHGMPQDYKMAVELYREAALNGNGYAIRDLAFVESQAEKAGIVLDEFELPEHLYEASAPAIQAVPDAGTEGRSGLRASCNGNLEYTEGSRPSLQFECSVRGNHGYIYPGEHASVRLPDNTTHVFRLDAGLSREPVNDFLQNSVLPAATSVYGID